MDSITIDFSQCILGSGIAAFGSFRNPCNRLLRVSGTIFQPQLTQSILRVHVAKPGGTFPIVCGSCIVFSRTGSCVEHLSQTILEFIIMAVCLQRKESRKCILKVCFSLPYIPLCSNPIPVHFCQFIIRIGISLLRRTSVKIVRLLIALLLSLSPVIQSGKGILRVLVVCCHCPGKPLGCLFIILFGSQTGGKHLADAVLQVGTLFFFCMLFLFQKRRQCLDIPFLRTGRIDLPPQPVCQHPSQVVHGQSVTGLRFQYKEAEGFCEVRFLLFASIKIFTGFLIPVVPPFLTTAFSTSALCIFLLLPFRYCFF